LFPATEYLRLVWQTFAESRRLLVNDLSVIFENCKFIRAVTMPKNGLVKFIITIQRGNGNFEVMDKDGVVATGRITPCCNMSQEQVKLEPHVRNTEDPTLILEQDEIYKELNLRGYNYRQDRQCLVDSFINCYQWYV
jgi:fatty acid synthase